MLYLRLIILSVGDDVSVDSETLLVTDFVNLKIETTQSFESIYRGKMYVHMFIVKYSYMYEYICLYLKNISGPLFRQSNG
jgi:hypothetical protein